MRRFFIRKSALIDGVALVEGELFRHMIKVLRCKVGDRMTLVDGEGAAHDGVLTSVEGERASVRIESTADPSAAGATLRITLIQGIPKGDRMELILQKGSELGANSFVPLLSSRVIPRLSGDKALERVCRWERIAAEAARQSRRNEIPRVGAIVSLAEALAAAGEEVKLLLWEEESQRGLREVLEAIPRPASVALLVGPEGGFSREEAEEAMGAGFIPVTLGPRILRTETAGLAVLAILQYVWGDVG
jgi:16S rRNA (uracil1498-N3)-methyltransferase